MIRKDFGEWILELHPADISKKGKVFQKLLKRCPKKYWDRIYNFSPEDDLIDGCKYLLTLDDSYSSLDYESIPCNSINEAIEFIKLATKRRN